MARSSEKGSQLTRKASRKSIGSADSKTSSKASSSAPRSVVSQASAKFDGPNSPSGGSPRPSTPKSPRPAPSVEPTVRSVSSSRIIKNKNVDLGAIEWALAHGIETPSNLPLRPRTLTKLGQETKIGLNTFSVVGKPSKPIHQYEVMIGSGEEKRGVISKVWASKKVQGRLGQPVLFDGDRLAWAPIKIDREVRETVDLDQEAGKKPREGKSNTFRVVIRHTKEVQFDQLADHLRGKPFTNGCLEAINCLDHILREHPAQRLIKIKRAFFPRDVERFALGGGLEAIKGVYSSLRMALGAQGPCLSINVDVANGTFFQSGSLLNLLVQITGCRDIPDLVAGFKNSARRERLIKDFKRLQKTRVIASHRGSKAPMEYVIDKFDFRSAKEVSFVKDDKKVTIYDYFKKAFNVTLNYPDLPMVRTAKQEHLPLEVLSFKPDQVCRYKLDERQTSNMIKFAVTPPNERWKAVQQGLNTLNWAQDPVLNAYGLKISTTRTVVPARVLTAPKVQYANGAATPGTSGRWDLKGKKFLTPNTAPLKSWAVCVVSGRRGGKPDKTVIQGFITSFINTYGQHGGRVENKQPPILLSTGNDPGEWVTATWNAGGTQSNSRPQILVFILPDKDSIVYNRIKRSCDCRYGVVSQCMQYAHVQKGQGQYISNVLMKFNSKLGGITCRAIGAKSGGETGLFTASTVVIGADVSHAAPGSTAASMAALTISMDKLGTRYAAAVDTNGHRVEMISEKNIKTHLQPMLQHWCQTVNNGKLPARVLYIRDGVSEGQYVQVLQQEVYHMKNIFKAVAPSAKIDFVVIIAGKRHHIRFFPEKGDKNGNPLPGTLVESGATHPWENDFFLCSHAAIKGTARPTHYQIICNEANLSNEEIYTLLYEQVYQYARATTPVSIHPAVYYAHIASNRAVSHDRNFGSSDGTPAKDSSDTSAAIVADPLLEMPDQGNIRTSMWYI